MTTTTEAIAIKKTGNNYYYFSRRAQRLMPMKKAEAELMISTGSGVITSEWF